MTITPQGNVYLCNTPLLNDYNNQLTFNDRNSQNTYFNSKIRHTFNDFVYVPENNQIVVDKPIDKIRDCNYLFYKNNGFTDKDNNVRTFYCFITNMEYVSVDSTLITFETDVFQTYQFDFTIKPSFIEREHVSSDNPGEHTIPEGLEIGDFVIDDIIKQKAMTKDNCCYILASRFDTYVVYDGTTPKINKVQNGGGIYNGIVNGLKYYFYDNTDDGIAKLQETIQAFSNSGVADAIDTIFIVPNFGFQKHYVGESNCYGYIIDSKTSYNMGWESYNTPQIYKPSSLNGYTPRNKKLLTHPYCYMVMNNGNGGNALFKYELFKNPETPNICDFIINTALTPGMSINLKPQYYKTSSIADPNQSEALPGGKYPICGWISDSYTNWLTQNALNIKLGIVASSAQVGLGTFEMGAFPGQGSQNILGGLSNIFGSMKEIYLNREFMTPQSESNVNTGDVNFSTSNSTFTCYKMSIKQEYARIIDSYFDKFGYKVNELKTPNYNSRTNWNFLKTIDINIDSNCIPQNEIQILKDMFNKGVTLWHNPSTIFDYSQSNNIR